MSSWEIKLAYSTGERDENPSSEKGGTSSDADGSGTICYEKRSGPSAQNKKSSLTTSTSTSNQESLLDQPNLSNNAALQSPILPYDPTSPSPKSPVLGLQPTHRKPSTPTPTPTSVEHISNSLAKANPKVVNFTYQGCKYATYYPLIEPVTAQAMLEMSMEGSVWIAPQDEHERQKDEVQKEGDRMDGTRMQHHPKPVNKTPTEQPSAIAIANQIPDTFVYKGFNYQTCNEPFDPAKGHAMLEIAIEGITWNAQLDEAYERRVWEAGRKKDALEGAILEDQPKHTNHTSSEDTSKTVHAKLPSSERTSASLLAASQRPRQASITDKCLEEKKNEAPDDGIKMAFKRDLTNRGEEWNARQAQDYETWHSAMVRGRGCT